MSADPLPPPVPPPVTEDELARVREIAARADVDCDLWANRSAGVRAAGMVGANYAESAATHGLNKLALSAVLARLAWLETELAKWKEVAIAHAEGQQDEVVRRLELEAGLRGLLRIVPFSARVTRRCVDYDPAGSTYEETTRPEIEAAEALLAARPATETR